jgi:hypothetical protein
LLVAQGTARVRLALALTEAPVGHTHIERVAALHMKFCDAEDFVNEFARDEGDAASRARCERARVGDRY